jgi:uncharacterized paraquat-inducible protein A
MSQIKISSLALGLILSLSFILLSGCGDKNSQATFDAQSSTHPASWLPTGHKVEAKAHILNCTECHGNDFTGGISKVSCLQCHTITNGNTFAVHPEQWGQFAYAFHADYVGINGTTSCANASCHGADLLGVANSGPSCAINCHMAGTAQAPQKHAWDSAANVTGHIAYFATNPINFNSCRNHACHGGEGTTAIPPGVFLSGPACLDCHGSGNPLPAEI